MTPIQQAHVLEQIEAMKRDHFELKKWHLFGAFSMTVLGIAGYFLTAKFGLPIWSRLITLTISAVGAVSVSLAATIVSSAVIVTRRQTGGDDEGLEQSVTETTTKDGAFVPRRQLLKLFLLYFAIFEAIVVAMVFYR